MSTRTQQVFERVDKDMDKMIISNVASGLLRRSQDELDPIDSVMLLEVSYAALLDWIASRRIVFLPAEGSSGDNLLGWARQFIERWHTFYKVIEEFVDDASLACQLAYGFCGTLLEVCSG
jgi:hypothetical protein